MRDDVQNVTSARAATGGEHRPGGHGVTLSQAFRVWLRVASLSFGGPAGQIAVMHRIIVEERKWIGEGRFLHALNYCMLLPGPEAQQLATYIGWIMHRTRGGIIAGGLFVLPGALAILALSYVYAAFGSVPLVASIFFGLKSAVIAIVLQAVIRIGRRALKTQGQIGMALTAFVAIFLFGVPFPIIIIAAGIAGYVAQKAGLDAFRRGASHASDANALRDADSLLGETLPDHVHATAQRSLRVAAVWLLLWLVPVAVIVVALGTHDTFSQIALFFSKMAVVTFGGAYAVLAYVAQQAVDTYAWVRPTEMLDGLGMAETTPGPLIMVTQFVGFMGAYRNPGHLHPMLAGTFGALLTTWVTFVPCFLWIFLGAPYVERLRGNDALNAALSSITAAVVGVILNLAVWFAIHAWFAAMAPYRSYGLSVDLPVLASVRPWAVALSVVAIVAIFRLRLGILTVLAGCSLAGIVLDVAGLA